MEWSRRFKQSALGGPTPHMAACSSPFPFSGVGKWTALHQIALIRLGRNCARWRGSHHVLGPRVTDPPIALDPGFDSRVYSWGMRTLLPLLVAAAISATAQMPAGHTAEDHAKMHVDGVAQGGRMDRHFSDATEWAKEFDDPARDAWQIPDKVLAALDLKREQRVADLGAGTGYFSVRLAKLPAAPKVYAVDIEPSMIAHLKSRAEQEGLKNLIAVQATESSPSLPEPVDLVLIVDTYHHLSDRPAYLQKLANSLKPGGRLAIVDFRKGGPMGPPDEFRFTKDELVAELNGGGFQLAATHDFLPNQMFLVFQRK